MFSTSTIAAAAAIFASVGLAAPTARQTEQFSLKVTSVSSHKYLNATLNAAHSGAGEEALIPSTLASGFTFNTTAKESPAGYTDAGYIQYYTPYNVEEQLNSVQNATDNVEAFFFLNPGAAAPATFAFSEDEGRLFKWNNEQEVDAYFYICTVYSTGDAYNTLSYVPEGTTPDNDSCDPVTVYKGPYNS